MWSGTKTPSRPSSSARSVRVSASATVSCQIGSTTPYCMTRLLPGGGGGRAQHLVPRPREPSLLLVARVAERALAVPLAARQLVVHLETVAVGVREVDADRDRVIGDVHGDVAGLQPVIHLGQVLERLHAPGHVVQPDLALLLR